MEALVESLKGLQCRVDTGMWNTWSNVFVQTNEIGARTMLSSLRVQPLVGNTIIGTSCLFNLDILLSRLERDRKETGQFKIENLLIVRSSRIRLSC